MPSMFQNASAQDLDLAVTPAPAGGSGDVAVTGSAQADPRAPRVAWNTGSVKASYANYVTGNATREEVVMTFGVSRDWDRVGAEIQVDLDHRVVISPSAAKRLAALLNRLVAEYEKRYGELKTS